MEDKSQTNKLLSIGEASDYLGVSIDTLRRWEKKDKILSHRSPGGHRYFKKEDLDNLFGTKYERTEETKHPKKEKVDEVNKEKVEDIKVRENDDITISQKVSYNIPYAPIVYPTIDVIPNKERASADLVERPARDVKIPQIELIKIIQEKEEVAGDHIEEVKEEVVSASILTPQAVINPSKLETQPQLQPTAVSGKSDDIKEKVKSEAKPKNNMMLYAVITVLVIFAIGFIFFLIGASTQEILSPVP